MLFLCDMSKVEQGVEQERGYTHLVPIEGHPGKYTYKDLDEGRVESVINQIHQFEVDKLRAEMIASGERVAPGELKLVPLEGYPGKFTFRPADTE